MYEMKDLCE